MPAKLTGAAKQSSNPLLSVIVPIYNVEKFLPQCLDSLLSQTYSNLDIILVDDGSKDSSGAICDRYARTDCRIRVRHQENGGLSAARNAGLAMAHGDYVAFLDSDDWIEPGMYRTLMQMIREHRLDMARCACRETDGANYHKEIRAASGHAGILFQGRDILDLYFGEFLCKVVWNAVYQRRIVDGIASPPRLQSEDNYVSGRYLARSKRMMITDDILYNYRRNPSGISHSGKLSRLDICLCLALLLRDLQAEHPGGIAPDFLKKLHYALARQLFHFIRSDSPRYRTAAMRGSMYRYIQEHLDFLRFLRFRWQMHKKHIRVIPDEKEE